MTDKESQLLELLVKLYEQETCLSSRHEIDHPYHRVLVMWGKLYPQDIVSWLIKKLDCKEGDRSWTPITVLSEIIEEKEQPHIPRRYAGRFDRITELWLEWGKNHNYLI